MPNALIYLPNFIGHRQVHAFIHSHILTELGYKIFIAGNFSNKAKNSFYLDKLIEDEKVIKIDTNTFSGNGKHINNAEFIQLQETFNIDLTIFAEADNHIPLFISQLIPKNKRLKGRVVGIFLRPWHFYRKLDFISKLKYIAGLRKTWKIDSRLFHEFFNKKFNLLDSTLHLDEFFVSQHKQCIWLPDVWQEYADKLVPEAKSDQRIWIERLDAFKEINKGRQIIFYFGTAQKRRGYDILLKLAIDHDACFIHSGLRNEAEKFNFDIHELRGILSNENRLFENNEFLTDPYCIEYFFKSVSHIVLPYDESFLGSSGVMLQALSYGIPVLVRDAGLIGFQVKKYNLGLTFNDRLNLYDQFKRFIEIPTETYSDSIKKYMNYQSVDRFEQVLIDSFKNKLK